MISCSTIITVESKAWKYRIKWFFSFLLHIKNGTDMTDRNMKKCALCCSAFFSRALNAWNHQTQDLICELYISLEVFYEVVINTHIYLTVHISSTNTILLNVISAQNLIYIPAFQYKYKNTLTSELKKHCRFIRYYNK